MATMYYQPRASQPRPVSHHTLAQFLAVSVHRHSRFPGSSGSQGFYHNLLSSTYAPTNFVALGMLYMTKLHTINSSLLQEHPGDLLFTACLLLSFGSLDDNPYNTHTWSLLSGYPKKQISSVTRRILLALEYRLAITPTAFLKYKTSMLKYVTSPIRHACPTAISPLSSPPMWFSRPKLLHPNPIWSLPEKDIFHPVF